MCNASLKKLPESEAAFLDVYQSKPANSSEQEMKDIAAVKLGRHQFRQAPVEAGGGVLWLRFQHQFQVRRGASRSGLGISQGEKFQGNR